MARASDSTVSLSHANMSCEGAGASTTALSMGLAAAAARAAAACVCACVVGVVGVVGWLDGWLDGFHKNKWRGIHIHVHTCVHDVHTYLPFLPPFSAARFSRKLARDLLTLPNDG